MKFLKLDKNIKGFICCDKKIASAYTIINFTDSQPLISRYDAR